jgi:hypothetical protein
MSNTVTAITDRLGWTASADLTAAVTTPAVAARKYETVNATAGVCHIEPGAYANALELRFSGTTDADSLVFDLLACRGTGDWYTRIATLTCTVGTMRRAGATNLFVDTIVISNEFWAKPIKVVSNAGNYIATVIFDRLGYKDFVLAPTTISAGTAIVEWSGF